LEKSSPTCYQDHVKLSFQTGKGKNPTILIMGQKTGIYPDFNMRILACGKGIS